MTKYLLLAFLLVGGSMRALGQTIIQGDSLFMGLQIGKSSLARVKSRLGSDFQPEKVISESTGMLRGGGCITIKEETGVSLHYREQGLICHVITAKEDRGLVLIEFDSTANVSSARGVQPGKHRFRDVVARYGPIDLDKQDQSLPKVQEVRRGGKQWYTVLVFSTITFVSLGRKQPGEDLLQRPISGIWLEND